MLEPITSASRNWHTKVSKKLIAANCRLGPWIPRMDCSTWKHYQTYKYNVIQEFSVRLGWLKFKYKGQFEEEKRNSDEVGGSMFAKTFKGPKKNHIRIKTSYPSSWSTYNYSSLDFFMIHFFSVVLLSVTNEETRDEVYQCCIKIHNHKNLRLILICKAVVASWQRSIYLKEDSCFLLVRKLNPADIFRVKTNIFEYQKSLTTKALEQSIAFKCTG